MTQFSCGIAGELCSFSPGELGETEVAEHREVFGEAKVEGGVQLLRVQESHEQLG